VLGTREEQAMEPEPGWTSWALARLDLSREELATRVARLAGLPDTPQAAEVVDLHLCALDVSLEVGSPELLVPQLEWEVHRWHQVSDGPGGPRVGAALRLMLAEHLDELTLLSVVRHVEAADTLAAAGAGRARTRRTRSGLAGLSGDVDGYLEHAVAGRDGAAVGHVLGLADAGWSVPELLLGVIGPAQDELGRLWERGAISVAQEHMATAVTHLAMYALYPRLFDAERLGHALVAATVPGDRHSVGLRMVSDLLQHRGWEVHYVGTSCPVPDLLDTVVESGARLLLLGASMTCHLPVLREVIEQTRADRRCDGLTVMVGGRPFSHARGLGEWAGADLVGTHAVEAVAAATSLLAAEAPSRE
jgi:methanogenic corrinoid protein MtbC1